MCLFNSKPLPDPILIFCELAQGTNLSEIWIENNGSHSKNEFENVACKTEAILP